LAHRGAQVRCRRQVRATDERSVAPSETRNREQEPIRAWWETGAKL